jgi:hypothetical protein
MPLKGNRYVYVCRDAPCIAAIGGARCPLRFPLLEARDFSRVRLHEELVSDYKYDYGYGHGYHRFAAILGQLECYRDTEKKDYYTRMPESAALVILRSVVQNSYTSAAGTSMTQYSAIYNNEKKTVEVWPFQNYSKSFTFDVEGNQISSDQ